MIPSLRRSCIFAIIASAVLAAGGRALADDDSNRQAAAVVLFREGRKLLEAGNYQDACPKFADSLRLDSGVGTMLNLAYCYERLGRSASAWSAYLSAAAAARDKGETDRARVARARAASLETTLLKLTILVTAPTAAEAPTVSIDGTPVPATLWGVPVPVDPGLHRVTASQSGRRTWSEDIRVETPDTSPHQVTIPPLEPDMAPPPPPVPSSPVAPRRVASIVLGSAGATGLLVAAGLAIAAKVRYDAAACNRNYCTALGEGDRRAAFGEANAASVCLATGAAAIVSGVVLWRSAPTRRVAIAWTPWLNAQGGGVTVERAW